MSFNSGIWSWAHHGSDLGEAKVAGDRGVELKKEKKAPSGEAHCRQLHRGEVIRENRKNVAKKKKKLDFRPVQNLWV